MSKTEKLRMHPGMVLYRWYTTRNKIEGRYSALADIRLEFLAVGAATDTIKYSVMAPIFRVVGDRPQICLHYEDLSRITKSSNRHNTLVKGGIIRDGEVSVPVDDIGSFVVDQSTDSDPRITDICNAPALPVNGVVVPPLYRMSRKMDTIVPYITNILVEALGFTSSPSVPAIKKAFIEDTYKIGIATDNGWVLPFDFVYKGGMVVVCADCIKRSNGPCFQTYLTTVKDALTLPGSLCQDWVLPKEVYNVDVGR